MKHRDRVTEPRLTLLEGEAWSEESAWGSSRRRESAGESTLEFPTVAHAWDDATTLLECPPGTGPAPEETIERGSPREAPRGVGERSTKGLYSFLFGDLTSPGG